MSGPLSDVTVIDLTQMLAGPFTTMLLADMGADVVKVEPPEGDMTRVQGPFLDDDELREYGGYFQSVNRGKRSIVLDLKTDNDRNSFLSLIDTADILVENYRVGVMDRLGLSYETLQERNPALVYAAVRGFGDPRTGESPYNTWPAFDVVAQAMGGVAGITGQPDAGPTKVGPGAGDIFPGTLAAAGSLAALHHARLTGEGQFIDVAMYDGILALCERMVYQYSYDGLIAQPQGNSHPLLSPFDIFPASDGWVAIAAPRDHQWSLLTQLINRPELATDPDLATNNLRVAHRAAVYDSIAAWSKVRTRDAISTILGGKVPFGPVNTAETIFRDPHVHARRMLIDVEQPGSTRTVSIAGSPVKFSLTSHENNLTRAPLLGEHTSEVLDSLE